MIKVLKYTQKLKWLGRKKFITKNNQVSRLIVINNKMPNGNKRKENVLATDNKLM